MGHVQRTLVPLVGQDGDEPFLGGQSHLKQGRSPSPLPSRPTTTRREEPVVENPGVPVTSYLGGRHPENSLLVHLYGPGRKMGTEPCLGYVEPRR